MKNLLFLLVVYIMGYLTAIPIGATQIEIAKRSLNGYLKSALMIVWASALSDVFYGTIAFFGIAPFLKGRFFMSLFWTVGAIILFILGFYTLRNNTAVAAANPNRNILQNKKISFITGFSLAITNPMMIFWWLMGAELVKELKLVTAYSPIRYILFLICGGLGLASYLSTLSIFLYKMKKFISPVIMKRINIILGIALIIFAIYFSVRAAKIFYY